tara:strand:- start:1943 stop:2992 length:1050 start_codon:yes stop_codon:yes gene_type:complete
MPTQHIARPEWLGRRDEAILEPGRPICDAHHHLWNRPNNRYLAEDFAVDLASGHNIVSTVFVECESAYRSDGIESLRPVGETEFAVRESERATATHASSTTIAAGIIGFVDLRLGAEVEHIVSAHEQAGRGRFRGIRHCVAADADNRVPTHRKQPPLGLLADDSFLEGFACLAPFGASFEAWAYHPQLPELLELARAFPETTIVLNHVGGPVSIGPYADNRATVIDQWRNSISALAQCPNVYVKLGGFGISIHGFAWETLEKPPSSETVADATGAFIHHCINCFGIERALFESNFPVDKVSYSYAILWNAFKRVASRYPTAEQDALFHDNAIRLYRLNERTDVRDENIR